MQDLARAVEIDPTDELVISNALRWGSQALTQIAAANFVAGISDDRETLALALRALKSARVPIASRLQIHRGMHAKDGWRGRERSVLELRIRQGGIESSFVLDADPAHPLATDGWFAAKIAFEMESAG